MIQTPHSIRRTLAMLFLAWPGFVTSLIAQDKKKELFAPQPPLAVVPYKGPAKIDYDTQVFPILENKCFSCHSGPVKSGKYDMSTVEQMIQGGKTGKAIVPGKPAESFLIHLAGKTKVPAMPPKDDEPLTPDELAIVKEWIAQGAKPGSGAKPAKATLKFHRLPTKVQSVFSLALSSDKKLIAIGRGAVIQLHETGKGAIHKTLIDPNLKDDKGRSLEQSQLDLVHSLVFSPDGKTLVAGGYQELSLWDVEKGNLIKKLTGFSDRILAMDFSPDGKTLAISGGAPSQDGEVRIVRFPEGDTLLELKSPHSDSVFGVRYRSDGKMLATSSADKFAKVWIVQPYIRPELYRTAAGMIGSCISLNSWASRYHLGVVEAAKETWRPLLPGELFRTFEGHTNHVTDIAWRPDGQTLATSGADNIINVWDLERGERIRTIGGHTKPITRLSPVTNGPFVISACGDSGLRKWNIDNGGNVSNYSGATDFQHAIASSSDGSLVAAGGEDGIVRVFNGQNSQLLLTLPPPAVQANKTK